MGQRYGAHRLSERWPMEMALIAAEPPRVIKMMQNKPQANMVSVSAMIFQIPRYLT